MKTLVAIILCGLLAAEPLLAQTTTVPVSKSSTTNSTDWTVLECVLMLTIVAAAGVAIIYIQGAACNSCTNKRLILERSECNGEWTPIHTNDVTGICTNKWEIFRDYTKDPACRYRIKIEAIPPHYAPEPQL